MDDGRGGQLEAAPAGRVGRAFGLVGPGDRRPSGSSFRASPRSGSRRRSRCRRRSATASPACAPDQRPPRRSPPARPAHRLVAKVARGRLSSQTIVAVPMNHISSANRSGGMATTRGPAGPSRGHGSLDRGEVEAREIDRRGADQADALECRRSPRPAPWRRRSRRRSCASAPARRRSAGCRCRAPPGTPGG